MTRIADQSEFDVTPTRILLHHPGHGDALRMLSVEHLTKVNFLDFPDSAIFHHQYDKLAHEIAARVETLFLSDILNDDPDYLREAADNPNLMFTRDSSVTLPWRPDVFIPARFALPSRALEPAIVAKALGRLGMRPALAFLDDEFLEGGDVYPAMDSGKRMLLVGFGVRTTKAAAIRLALELIPEHVDTVIGLSHDPELLHLDTGFTILPNRVVFAAAGMFTSGFMIDEDRRLSQVNPIEHAEQMGFTIVRCDKADAVTHERCNMLPLGGGRYLSFTMPADIKAELEQRAKIQISCVDGSEIAKATGGVHCLTRPIYL
jgi:N-dimethylarginine dimethylaminohydrolase